MRRCFVLNLDLPKDDNELIELLIGRGQLHFAQKCAVDVCRKAAELLVKDRAISKDKGVRPPGQAEYLDMLRALTVLGKNTGEQLAMLEKISEFALRKYPVMHD